MKPTDLKVGAYYYFQGSGNKTLGKVLSIDSDNVVIQWQPLNRNLNNFNKMSQKYNLNTIYFWTIFNTSIGEL